MLPNTFHKQLANIKKTRERKKRGTSSDKTVNDDDATGAEDEQIFKSVKKSQPER